MSLEMLANAVECQEGEAAGDSVSAVLSIVAYEPQHLILLSLQPHQEHLHSALRERGYAEKVHESGPAWTALLGEIPIGCGGFIEHWQGRATAWAILSDDAGPHLLALTREVRRRLIRHSAGRIEAQTLLGFQPAARWARLIGFEPECVLRQFSQGRDYLAFVFLKDG